MDYSDLKIPNHLAIIVDGNGRWAKARGKKRSAGHKAGFERLETIVKYAASKGIEYISLFVFSTENFKRSQEEVDYLMFLFTHNFKKMVKKFNRENIKVVFSGRHKPLKDDVYEGMQEMTELTKRNTGTVVNFCLNYGGHAEIVDATKKVVQDILDNKININEIDENKFNEYLYQELPPIDFLIRTSGEVRISNFMLWQLAYAEMYFPSTYFPDFDEACFDDAILAYNKRDRRFGGINYDKK
ncbi:MAG: di-trans,poly-cis-decaprenylcistransferase [Bacilli bacterium]|nr:di-trans,poly-cis-decaprenylcistransferase [Bacilli bacterium]